MNNAELFIQENDPVIRECVRDFSMRQVPYGTIHSDEDELYQVCVKALLEMGEPPDYLTLELKKAMCKHNLSLLPVNVSLSTTDYTKKLRAIKAVPMDSVLTFASIAASRAFQNAEFSANLKQFKGTLSSRDAEIVDLLLAGWSYADIGRKLNLSKAAMHRAKNRIAKHYASFMEDPS